VRCDTYRSTMLYGVATLSGLPPQCWVMLEEASYFCVGRFCKRDIAIEEAYVLLPVATPYFNAIAQQERAADTSDCSRVVYNPRLTQVSNSTILYILYM